MMNYIMLAISVSIDALGIGISYGMRKSYITLKLNILIAIIVFSMCLLGFSIGNFLSLFFDDFILKIIGSIILLILGSHIIIKETILSKNKNEKREGKEDKNEKTFVKGISFSEAISLAMAISMDAMTAGISASLIGIKSLWFPILVMICHMVFLSIGRFFGRYVKEASNIPQNLWSIISGVLLILISVTKLIIK